MLGSQLSLEMLKRKFQKHNMELIDFGEPHGADYFPQ